jgi:hypothetical protein
MALALVLLLFLPVLLCASSTKNGSFAKIFPAMTRTRNRCGIGQERNDGADVTWRKALEAAIDALAAIGIHSNYS